MGSEEGDSAAFVGVVRGSAVRPWGGEAEDDSSSPAGTMASWVDV